MSSKLLQPLSIKSMGIKNRISFGPVLDHPFGPNGNVTEDTIGWYVERAKGGAGLAITGTIYPCTDEALIQKLAGPFANALRLKNDADIKEYKKLTDAVHRYGMKIGAQTTIPGLMVNASPIPYPKPSTLGMIIGGEIPVGEITIEEMDQVKKDFADCAGRIRQSGFDCIELHYAHGNVNLLAGFMSPFCNRRTDEYGGNWENRLRYPREVIEGIRNVVGEDFPVLVRISADELLGSEGITLNDTIRYIVPMLEEAGVDCIDVSMGSQTHNPNNIPTVYVPRGHFMHLAGEVKKATRLPVIGVGRILDLKMAEKFLDEGKADIICLCRQLIADPETPKKYFENRPEDIRKCICDSPSLPTHPGTCAALCTINPTPPLMGACDNVLPAENKKKMLVIGGGVAGMETARISTLRGHEVILLEKEGRLGGNVDILANNPLNEEFRNIIDYLTVQLQKLGVDIRVCRTGALEDIKTFNPDTVVLATGATMTLPKDVAGDPCAMTHMEALKNMSAVGQNVVIQGLGYGAELAVFLAETGRQVTLFGKAGEIASNLTMNRRIAMVKRLAPENNFARGDGEIPVRNKANPKVLTETSFVELTASEVILKDKSGKETGVPCDSFIVSMGRKSNDALFADLEKTEPELYRIGDAHKIGEIFAAMKAANEIGRKI
jgi:2,4-dienoyl-CoA reductase-like NADH-dependent reductase (Old Yellow Enzyme family)/thioredoxin reductase